MRSEGRGSPGASATSRHTSPTPSPPPPQVYEVFTNNGDLNRLVVCFDIPDAGNTIRIINLATVEFPFYASMNQVGDRQASLLTPPGTRSPLLE